MYSPPSTSRSHEYPEHSGASRARSATALLTFSRHLCGRSKEVAQINIRKNPDLWLGGNEVQIGLQNGRFCQQRAAKSELIVGGIQSRGELVLKGVELGLAYWHLSAWPKKNKKKPSGALATNTGRCLISHNSDYRAHNSPRKSPRFEKQCLCQTLQH